MGLLATVGESSADVEDAENVCEWMAVTFGVFGVDGVTEGDDVLSTSDSSGLDGAEEAPGERERMRQ